MLIQFYSIKDEDWVCASVSEGTLKEAEKKKSSVTPATEVFVSRASSLTRPSGSLAWIPHLHRRRTEINFSISLFEKKKERE